MTMNPICDPETGICIPSSLNELQKLGASESNRTEIIYVGDPMCSWCWGISPALKSLRDEFIGKEISFRIVMGGLRPGGGDPWNDQMKDFLKHHWKEVNERSGQPFGYGLMELEDFNYDTEPSCRAVVAARPFVKHKELAFFEAIQRKFYVASQDPGKPSFYTSICDEFGVNYGEFLTQFESDEVKQETMEEFQLNRSWGVKGYPTMILLHNNQLNLIAHGYATLESMKETVNGILATETA